MLILSLSLTVIFKKIVWQFINLINFYQTNFITTIYTFNAIRREGQVYFKVIRCEGQLLT
jgi:hypothetical protein